MRGYLRLEARIGPNSYFYENNYVSQLARPSLDTLLQNIYRDCLKLIVVFIGVDYQRKDWCGIEFRAIREIIMERDHLRIMFFRTDEGAVEGVFKTDGYIDARRFSPAQIADFVGQRLKLLGQPCLPSTSIRRRPMPVLPRFGGHPCQLLRASASKGDWCKTTAVATAWPRA
jgi:hypothetical protein